MIGLEGVIGLEGLEVDMSISSVFETEGCDIENACMSKGLRNTGFLLSGIGAEGNSFVLGLWLEFFSK